MTPWWNEHARGYVKSVLGFDPGSSLPTSGYGSRFLGKLGMDRVGCFRYETIAGDAIIVPATALDVLRLGGHGAWAGDWWAAAVVLASLHVEHPHAAPGDRTELLACATTLLADDVVGVGWAQGGSRC